jgi:hypothetical protein
MSFKRLAKLLILLRQVKQDSDMKAQTKLCQEIALQSSKVAEDLTCSRHYMTVTPSSIYFDPRFLVFEFTYSIMLRKGQVILVNKFISALRQNTSMCHQMIMGAGKTTVVAPLLALMLADGKSLVTQVVPHALLEFSRGVMREKFSAVVRKAIFTFSFDRSSAITKELYMKLVKARDSRAIMCATPTSVKSLMLKLVEMLRQLEASKAEKRIKPSFFSLSKAARRAKESQVIKELKVNPEDVFYCVEILKLFKSGVLLLDEVDLLLHPLKSELNWPIGNREMIDFTKSKIGMGLRWQIQWHLLDAIFYTSEKKMTVGFRDSREAMVILDQITAAINRGIQMKMVQKTPHLVVLEKKFYHEELKQLMARWLLLYLRSKRLPTVDDRLLISYLVNGPNKDRQAAQACSVALSDDYMRMINLGHDLLRTLLPHVLSKINRVTFGLLSKTELKQFTESDPNISLTRQLAAVPFVGKDVPSQASQFAHPDIVIGLSILAYRYEGLRMSDFMNVLEELREQLDSEIGPIHKRPSYLRWVFWVEEAGAKVRGLKEDTKKESAKEVEEPTEIQEVSTDEFLSKPFVAGGRRADEIWPIHLLDLRDEQHMSVTYNLLRKLPQIIEYYLDTYVLPLVLEHHLEKISTSGQDLGGDMMFGRRVGFSGTPSDLLPEELGKCQFDEGVDGQIINYLTSNSIVSSRLLGADWSVNRILEDIACSNPPFHCLIDTGALITGMSNYEVAKYLLTHGLPTQYDGVVFLDHKDRQMILLRHGMNVVRLNQSGIPTHRRFSFYDQIHTT